jgi:hypothetical protein
VREDYVVGKYLMVVGSSALPGRDADYADWYEKIHLDEICVLDGVSSGRLYEKIEESPTDPGPTLWGVYELEADDPTTVLAEIGRLARSGEMKMPDSIDVSSAKTYLFKLRA